MAVMKKKNYLSSKQRKRNPEDNTVLYATPLLIQPEIADLKITLPNSSTADSKIHGQQAVEEVVVVDAVAEVEFCQPATSGDVMIINVADAVAGVWKFVHSGDDLTLTADTMTDGTAIMTFDFGSGTAEAAKWVQTLDRVIVDYNRCPLTDLCGRPR